MPNVLVGKKLASIQITSDRCALRFMCEDGDVVVRCYAECCSSTWIEAVENTASLPATVLSVKDIELNANLDTYNGEMDFYGCKIVTDHGHIIIDYRNESNGYYGGSLAWPEDGSCGATFVEDEWTQLSSLNPEG